MGYGVGMDGLKAEPARSFPLPVTKGGKERSNRMVRQKSKDKRLNIGAGMPPLYYTLPGKEYNPKNSEVLKWIAARPGLLSYVFDKLAVGGYIVYDPDTGKWQGVDSDGD